MLTDISLLFSRSKKNTKKFTLLKKKKSVALFY